MDIDIDISEEVPAGLDEHWLKSVVRETLKTEDPHGGGLHLGIMFVSKDRSRELNHRYRQKDVPTNVLSFPMRGGDPVPAGTPEELGDVVICVDVAREEAIRDNVSYPDRIAALLVHALLHLCGQHHDSTTEESAMYGKMEALLARMQTKGWIKQCAL